MSDVGKASTGSEGGSADAVSAFAGARRSKASRLVAVLPIVGLMVVPTVGLLYAATTSFGRDEATAEASATPASEDEEDGATSTKKSSKSRSKSSKAPKKSEGKARTDAAGLCCAKLRDLGKTGEVKDRGTYLSAAAACDAAPEEDVAYKRAKNQLKLAKLDVPDECDK